MSIGYVYKNSVARTDGEIARMRELPAAEYYEQARMELGVLASDEQISARADELSAQYKDQRS